MFEHMKTHGGGTITLIFDDEPTEEAFRGNFKTEEDFLKSLPDEANECSEEIFILIRNNKNEGLDFADFLKMSIVNSLFTKPMTKFSGPTKEEVKRCTEDADAARKVMENTDEDCRVCLNTWCPIRNRSFDENLYKKAVKEFTKN